MGGWVRQGESREIVELSKATTSKKDQDHQQKAKDQQDVSMQEQTQIV